MRSADDEASPTAGVPWHVWGHGPVRDDRRLLRFQTTGLLEIRRHSQAHTYIFLLLVNMADLEPDVLFVEWPRWIRDDVLEALLLVSAIPQIAKKYSLPGTLGICLAVCR